jgi:hypothetical protein
MAIELGSVTVSMDIIGSSDASGSAMGVIRESLSWRTAVVARARMNGSRGRFWLRVGSGPDLKGV